MGYLRNLTRALLGRKAATFDAQTLAALMLDQINRVDRVGTSYHSLVRQGFARSVPVFRAIMDIANSAASIPIEVKVRRAPAPSNHPVVRLLKRPSPTQSGRGMLLRAYAYYQLSGNAYFLGVAGATELARMRVIRSDRIEPRAVGGVVEYRYHRDQQEIIYRQGSEDARRPILHVAQFNPEDEVIGFSPLMPARTSIDRHNLADEWNANLLRNGAKPSGALRVEADKDGSPNLDSETFDRLKRELEEQYEGARNSGRPLLLEGGLKWEQMGLSPVDMDWGESRASAARDVATALGYPPMLLGIPGDNTFSNQREARLALWENTVIPLATYFTDELTVWLQSWFGDEVELSLNTRGVEALAPKTERIWERVKGVSGLSVNERRAELGLPLRGDEPEADEVLITAQEVPLSIGAVPRDLESVEEATNRDLDED